MKFRKNMQIGVSIIFLLLIFTTSISLVDFSTKNNTFDESSLSISPADDSYEENDFFTFAYDLSPFNGSWLSSINGLGNQSDDDYYRIEILLGNRHVKVNLTFLHSLGNIDMILFDDFGTPLYVSNSPTNDEFIDFIVPYDGIYFIGVFGNNIGNSYDLKWENYLNDDWMEDNDDYFNAWPVGDIYQPGLRILGNDEDWFRINLIPGDTIDVEIYFNHIVGDLDLELYDPTDSLNPRVTSAGTTDMEDVMFTVDKPGYWRIRVFHFTGDSNVDYTLNIMKNMGVFGDDWAEENDDFYMARWVTPGYYPDLKIVGYDEDWFQTYLIYGDVIDVDIYFSHFEGDLELELYSPSDPFTPQIGSYSTNDNEHITFTATMEGDWRIRVYRVYGGADMPYSLDIWLNKASIADDPYEENDFDSEAYDLTLYEGWWLSNLNGHGVQFDEDWYKIYVGPGFEHLIVDLQYNSYLGYVQLNVYDVDKNLMARINSPYDHQSFRFNLPSSGIYYIQVYGHNIGVNYDLQYLTVFTLEEQTWVSNVLEGFDIYLLDISPGFLQLDVDLLFNNTLGNISMILFDQWGTNITSYSRDGNEYIDSFVSEHGEYYLVIYGGDMATGPGLGLNGVEYDLWWDDIKTDLRPDDSYEMNNNFGSAHLLSIEHEFWETDESGLQFDEDWYEIHIEPGFERLIVEIMYDNAEGMLGFDIFDGNLTEITGNFSMVDDAFIDYVLPSSGIFYIRVFGDNTGNVYNLIWFTSDDMPIDQIPGFDVLILIVSIVGVSAVVIKIKRSKFKQQ